MYSELEWLPERPHPREEIRKAGSCSHPEQAFRTFLQIANSRMDFVSTARLDLAVQRYRAAHRVPADMPVVRLAMLGSSTLSHLHAGIRVAALRRGILLDIYEGPYGMYRQEVLDTGSGLHGFRPDVICFALDAHHLIGAGIGSAERVCEDLRQLWRTAEETLGSVVIQQTVLPIYWPLLGNQESRLPQSPASMVQDMNHVLRTHAAAGEVALLTVDTWAALDGILQWHEPALWHHAKQEIHPRVSNAYGEQLARTIAALKGKSAKCLVLDLDNTLWSGVIGDDGLEGILLGQGSAVGEAHVELQRYALQLAQRGIILAVCSKNDEKVALIPFAQHAEMLLRRNNIACFVANWQDKAENLRHIASTLNIGLDALVFVDDNPVERALVRRELPMVAVPELPDDISGYVRTIASAGYFETLHVTAEDRARSQQYRANAERAALHASSTDMKGFLAALQMELIWSRFDAVSLKRIVQLMHKSNQFNLTTRRYTEAEVVSLMSDPDMLTLQLRLTDTYGDNGIIALLVGRGVDDAILQVNEWLMSCRVLGRGVEQATLNLLVEQARELGYRQIVGVYRPTAKNGMVREHYPQLGFQSSGAGEDGSTRWLLDLEHYVAPQIAIATKGADEWKMDTSIAA